MRLRLLFTAGGLLGGLLFCTNSLTGGIGHEGEARVAGRVTYGIADSLPAGAAVYLRTADFTADTAAGKEGRVPDTRVDDEGLFVIDSVAAGSYCIEINDGNSFAAAIRCVVPEDSTEVTVPMDTLRKTGSIRGSLVLGQDSSMAVYVQIFGLDRFAQLDAQSDSFSISDVPAGLYNLRLITTAGKRPPTVVDNISVQSGRITRFGFVYESVDTARSGSVAISLNTSATGADIHEPLYRFPVLLRLRDDNFDFAAARPDGSDVRFVKNGGEPLPFEIERWNGGARTAEVWVRIDTLAADDSSQYITMLWGVTPEGAGSNGRSVFDTACGFQGVWHLGEAGADTVRDATANGFYGISYGMENGDAAEGIAGVGRYFDGVSSYIAMPATADSKLNFPENGYFTLSAWVRVDSLDGNYHAIVTKSNQLYGLAIQDDNLWEFYEFEEDDSWKSNQAEAQAGSWKHLCGVSAGAMQYLYVDGVCVDSTAEAIGGRKYRVTTDPVTIGKRTSSSVEGWFDGDIDEVRIESTASSPAWIRCSYMNQCSEDRLVKIAPRD